MLAMIASPPPITSQRATLSASSLLRGVRTSEERRPPSGSGGVRAAAAWACMDRPYRSLASSSSISLTEMGR